MLTSSQQTRISQIAAQVRKCAPMALATNFGSSVSGQDGGYAVPVDAAKDILMADIGALLPHCRELPVTTGGGIELPLDTATAYGEGVVVAWESEGIQLAQNRPKLGLSKFILKKLVALVPVSDELLEDSAALAAWLPLALQAAVTFKVNDAIINGTGAGIPLGIRTSGSLITVAKASAQVAGTIVEANIEAMLARSLTPDQSRWVANPACYGQIVSLASFDGASRTLAGLPILLTDACPAPGTAGDLILADLNYFVAATKTPQLNGSMHLWFDQDMTAFRLVFRMDGMPVLGAPITPPNATASKSHFVTTAVRT